MKTHLFYVHSVLHLLFAQATALELPLSDRKVLWMAPPQGQLGSVGILMQKILVTSLWENIEWTIYAEMEFPNPSRFIKKPLQSLYKSSQKAKALRLAYFDLYPDVVWVCHQFDYSAKTLCMLSRHNHRSSYFLEEGLSVYYTKQKARNSLIHKTSGRVLNLLEETWAHLNHYASRSQPIDEFIDELWLTMPTRKSIFKDSIKKCDLSMLITTKRLGEITTSCVSSDEILEASKAFPQSAYLLYLGSIEVEDNIIPIEDLIAAVKKMFVEKGFDKAAVVYKPHPRSQKSVTETMITILRELGCVVTVPVSTNFPTELVYPHLHCTAVLGGICSSLFYLQHLYGAKTHSALAYMSSPFIEGEINSIGDFNLYRDLL